ncbi:MAG: hypothetical protein ABSF88_07930 [Candidatus Aminicenantales bacterium]
MKREKPSETDFHGPVRKTLHKLEIEDGERKLRLRDRLRRLFRRRNPRPPAGGRP